MPMKVFCHSINMTKYSTAIESVENIHSEGFLQLQDSWPDALSCALFPIYSSCLSDIWISIIFSVFPPLSTVITRTHCFSLLFCYVYNLNIFPKSLFITYIHSFPWSYLKTWKGKKRKHAFIEECLVSQTVLCFIVYLVIHSYLQ